ncbi:MAG: DUF1987 domain-containing protein [Salinivirgaceae bacterium]|mgnify:CR=1 FL=1|jgi:hypothetical protein|nr:DUF1987 domain-containing protein [Bacteroidales bacterium]
MHPIICDSTIDLPKVVLDKEKGEFLFEGLSMCEDAFHFYEPIIAWIKQYGSAPNPKTEVRFKISYFNTASSKMLLDVMLHFDAIYRMGHDVSIHWHYRPEDEDMQEAGEIYASKLDIPVYVFEDEAMD